MGTSTDQQQVEELIAQTIDAIRLEKLEKEDLEVRQQDIEINQILEQLADEQRLEELERASITPDAVSNDQDLFMQNINAAELIDDTHQEELLTTLASTTPATDKLKVNPPATQGFFNRLRQLLNKFIPLFLTNIVNFFKQPNKPVEPTNPPLKPIKGEKTSTSTSTIAKQEAIKEVPPKDWHKSLSTRHQQKAASSTINKLAEEVINLQKNLKNTITEGKKEAIERRKKLLEKKSTNNRFTR